MYKREDITQVLQNKGWQFMPCPFCGSMDIGIKESHLESKAGEGPCVSTKKIWAYCRYCYAEGKKKTVDVIGLVDSVATALESWNYRKEDDKVSRNEGGNMSQETNMAMIAAIPTVPGDKLGVKYYAACPCGGVIAA